MTQKQFDARKRITVYLSAEEYAAIEARANGSVSSYARKVLLGDEKHEANRVPDVQPSPAIRETSRRESVSDRDTSESASKKSVMDRLPVVGQPVPAPKANARTCKHGTAQGYRCWQCGGKADVNA